MMHGCVEGMKAAAAYGQPGLAAVCKKHANTYRIAMEAYNQRASAQILKGLRSYVPTASVVADTVQREEPQPHRQVERGPSRTVR